MPSRLFKAIIFLAVTSMVAFQSPANAGLIVVSGKLLGATNISVGGELYDVKFEDGTCIDLFLGCDTNSDFTFHTPGEGVLASLALVEQVLLDGPLGNFHSNSLLINDCDWQFGCMFLTPYTLRPTVDFYVDTVVAENFTSDPEGDPGAFGYTGLYTDYDLRNSLFTYAVWSPAVPVPAPAPIALIALGLLGIGFTRRKRTG